MEWQLQDAKSQISALIRQSEVDGPQTITVHGIPAVVVMSVKEYETLLQWKPSLTAFLLAGDAWSK
jgi:prevent-host-death family protein